MVGVMPICFGAWRIMDVGNTDYCRKLIIEENQVFDKRVLIMRKIDDNSVDAINSLAKVFSCPSRVRIVESLIDCPRTVTEITKITGLPQPATSNHIRIMVFANALKIHARMGKWTYYKLTSNCRGLFEFFKQIVR